MVKGIIKGPGCGKTKELIEIAAEEHSVIVCQNVDRMLEKIHAYGYTGIEVISFADYLTHAPDFHKTYCIDDLGSLANFINIAAFTFTKED